MFSHGVQHCVGLLTAVVVLVCAPMCRMGMSPKDYAASSELPEIRALFASLTEGVDGV